MSGQPIRRRRTTIRGGRTRRTQRAQRTRLYALGLAGMLAVAALGFAAVAVAAGTPSAGTARAASTARIGARSATSYQISLTTAPNPITVGQPATFTGTVSPAPPREPVRVSLWRRDRFGWVQLTVSRAPAPTGAFSITRTFGAASRHGQTMLRICLHRRAYGARTCAKVAVTILPLRPRPSHHAARERHRQKLEEARRRAAEKRRQHKEERGQKRTNAHERHSKHKEAAHERKEARRQKEARAREERRRRREEAHRRRKEKRAGQ